MPLECVAITCAAQNHVVSGNFDRCIAVPAVSEVCRPQSRHSKSRGRLFKATARPLPTHAGQTNPSGHRRACRNAAQRASSGNSLLYGAIDATIVMSSVNRETNVATVKVPEAGLAL